MTMVEGFIIRYLRADNLRARKIIRAAKLEGVRVAQKLRKKGVVKNDTDKQI